MLVMNLILAVTWCFLWQSHDPVHIVAGLIFGFLVLRFHKQDYGGKIKPASIAHFVIYVGHFLKELILANFLVAKIVLTPGLKIKPGIIKYKLDVTSDSGITLLANSITLTPGTLTMEISKDRKYLYIHTLNIEDPRKTEEEIKKSLERPAMRVVS